MSGARPRICGAVLAAGEGTRFGSPKQLAELGGRPLIDHALAAMRSAGGISRRICVLGSNRDLIVEGADLGGFEVLTCSDWRDGLSASLRCAVRAAGSEPACDALLITLADQPLVSVAAIDLLAEQAVARGARGAALRTAYEGRAGHPTVIGAELFDELLEIDGDRGAAETLRRHGAELLDAGPLGSDVDVDTPEDLEKVRRRLSLAGTKGAPGAGQVR